MTQLLVEDAVSVDEGSYLAASRSLSGKRIALIGGRKDRTTAWTRAIDNAEGFTRCLQPSQVEPNSDILKPFELMVVDLESAEETAWLNPEKLTPAFAQRSILTGPYASLLSLGERNLPQFAQYAPYTDQPEELLLRCVLSLQMGRGSEPKPEVEANPYVVLADDDTSVTSIVRRALERNGLACHIAANGIDALEMVAKLKPCAAVLDVHMPALDGFEVLSRLKADKAMAATRVILLTGCEQENDVLRGFSLGADDYVCKPFNPLELTIRLMRVIGRL